MSRSYEAYLYSLEEPEASQYYDPQGGGPSHITGRTIFQPEEPGGPPVWMTGTSFKTRGEYPEYRAWKAQQDAAEEEWFKKMGLV